MAALRGRTRVEPGRGAAGAARQRGYAALIVVAIFALASLAATLDRLDPLRFRLSQTRDTASALQLAKDALVGYAVGYRDLHPTESFGYLPCPDMTGSGIERTPCGKAGATAIGLLPYKTLGMADVRDAAGNCLWYAVSGSFKANPKTSPFNWDTQGQITIRDAAGGRLVAPDDMRGGAAAVVLAPGPALSGQRRDVAGAGACGASAADAAAFLENDGDTFTTGVLGDGAGSATANDQAVWITAREIFDAVVRRGDFAAFMMAGIASMRSKLGTQRATAGNALPSTNPFGRQTSDYNFYEAWKDQFRYLRCATAGCYVDAAGGHHKALLLFGGRSATGSPRPSAARAPADYFEAALGLAQGQTPEACSTDAARYDNSSPSSRAADSALCLAP